YLFSNGTDPGSISRRQKTTQAFGKLTYSSGSHIRSNFSVLTTPTRSTGTLSTYDGIAPIVIASSKAGNAAQLNRGFKADQNTFSGDVDAVIKNSSFVTVRGGYFYDNYADRGI